MRYFNVFGRRQDHDGAYAAVIPRFIKSLVHGEAPLVHGDGLQSRDFTYVDNVVQVNQLAALVENAEALNTVYNVAYGENTTLIELFRQLVTNLAEFDEQIAYIKPVFGPERQGDVRHSLASIDKARSLLGYQPAYSLGDGLKLASAWYWDSMK